MFKKFLIIITTLALTLNANAGTDNELILKKNKPSEVKDCFESVNRATFAFNEGLDEILFQPIAGAYRSLPSPVKNGVSNSLDNLSQLVTIPNNILQGELGKAAKNSGRFLINTTLGVLGLFDVAQNFGINANDKEDYGQSLGKAGAGPGCYVVLPILGPSTARDTAGSFVGLFGGGDAWYNITVKNDTQHFSDMDYYTSKGIGGVDFRAKNYDSLENLEKNSLDFYASVKSLYLQDRQQKIINNKKIINTQNDGDWDEIDSQ